MWWSATTVLDRGSVTDPPLNLLSASWWTFQLAHPTWWRIVGISYLMIAGFLSVSCVGWLLIDAFGQSAMGLAPAEPICMTRYVVRVWHPTRRASRWAALLCTSPLPNGATNETYTSHVLL